MQKFVPGLTSHRHLLHIVNGIRNYMKDTGLLISITSVFREACVEVWGYCNEQLTDVAS
jgi:hypothetical protein